MTDIKCSVIVPISHARNKKDTLFDWLGSPEIEHFEIILVHDLADGESHGEYKKYVQEFPKSRITLLSGNFGNPGEARNLGLSQASGKWVAFWDSDDFPDLKSQVAALEKAESESADLIISDFRTVNDNAKDSRKEFRVGSRGNLAAELIARPGIWRLTFRKAILDNKFFTASRMAEDQVFIAECEIFDLRITVSNQVTYSYSIGNNAHLVNFKPALADLFISIKSLKAVSRNQSGMNLFLSNGYIVKNLITALMKCRLNQKISSLLALIIVFIKHPVISAKCTLVLLREKRRKP